MRLRILIAFLLCGTFCPAAETFRYTAELERVRPESKEALRVDFTLRKDGEPYSVCSFLLYPDYRHYAVFVQAMPRLAKEAVYYELLLSREAPRATGPVALSLGMVTRETAKDLAEFSRGREARSHPPEVEAADIQSLREISQNDFLGIKPRIIKP